VFGIQQARHAWQLGKEKEETKIAQRKAEQRLAESYLERGQSLCEQGETGLGMLWLARSLKTATGAGDSDLGRVIRSNLAGWRPELHALRASYRHPEGVPTAVALSHDSRSFVLGNKEGTAVLYRTATGSPAGKVFRHPGPVSAVAFAGDGTVLTGGGTTIVVSSALLEKELCRFERHGGKVTCLAVSRDGKLALSGSLDGTAWLWDVETGKEQRCFSNAHKGGIFGVAFSPSGQRVLTGGADGAARLWDVQTGEQLCQFPRGDTREVPFDKVFSVAFSPNGQSILAGGVGLFLQGEAKQWEVATGKLLARLPHQAAVYTVAFDQAGRTILTAGQDRAARLWEAGTGKPLGRPLWHPKEVLAAAFSSNGRAVLTLAGDQVVRLWEPAAGRPCSEFDEGFVTAAVFARNGELLLTGVQGFQAEARLYGVDAKAVAEDVVKAPAKISAVAASPDGETLAAAWPEQGESVCRLWRARMGEVTDARFHSLITCLAVAGGGKAVVVGCDDGSVFLSRQGEVSVHRLEGHHERVWSAAFSPTGDRILTGSRDGTAQQWDAGTCKPLGSPLEHPDAVLAVAFSGDGRTILTGYVGGARMWDAATGKLLDRPVQLTAGVACLALGPRGDVLLTGDTSQAARLWDTKTKKLLGPPLRHRTAVMAVAFRPNGKRVVTVSPDGAVRTWAVPAAVAEETEAVRAWSEVISGLRLNEQGEPHVLSGKEWSEVYEGLAGPGCLPRLEQELQAEWAKALALPSLPQVAAVEDPVIAEARPAPAPPPGKPPPRGQDPGPEPRPATQSPKPAGGDGKKLEGTWTVLQAQIAGTEIPEDDLRKVKVVITGTAIKLDSGQRESDFGTYKVDATQNLWAVDITSTEGKTLLGIYALEGDQLKICWNQEAGERPKKFPTQPDPSCWLLVLKRAKP
jgi:uncharacterized protein (TIGR03067 family)